MPAHVLVQPDGVDALGTIQESGVVADRPQDRAALLQQFPRPGPDITETDQAESGLVHGDPVLRKHFFQDVNNSLAGGLFPSVRTAEMQRFAGNDSQPVQLPAGIQIHVGVGHPGHDLCVGPDVGGGHVDVRTDIVSQGAGKTPGQAHEFLRRQGARIKLHAALCPA